MKLKIQDLLGGVMGLLRKLIPDADKRKEVELAIITLMHNLRSKWMINILTLAWVGLYFAHKFGFVTYTEFDYTILLIMIAFHYGISPENAIKVYEKVRKWFKDLKDKP